MIRNVLYIAAGSAAGGVCRYLLSKWINEHFPALIPWGTFFVNITGCFLTGIFYALAARQQPLSPSIVLFLTTGFCGGFTTFSAFAFENMQLLKTGAGVYAFAYTAISLVTGIGAVFLGFQIIK
ncbi:fluoride efflux transporter CrcB [Pollutibacter soli]|uniref:fluoride efflux transporter CrcB n=1 Tax=Pollutibacter soli TaxID=3034157 RepID=UPI00301398D4